MAAAKKPKTAIEVGVNEQPAAAGLKRLVRNFGSASIQINQSLDILSKGWGIVTGAIGGAISQIDKYLDLAAEQERVENRAIAAIRLRNDFSQAEFDALQRSNAERQRALGIGDEEQLALQGTLAAMGVRKELLDDATRATIGLAEVTGQGLNEAARAAAKALTGQVTALNEYGIKVTTVAEAQDKLNGYYAIAEAQSRTLSTRVKVLQAAWGDFGEVLGGVLNKSETASQSFDILTDFVTDFTNAIGSDAGRAEIDTMVQGLATLAAVAASTAVGFRTLRENYLLWKDGFIAEPLEGAGQVDQALRTLEARLLALANGDATSQDRAPSGSGGRFGGRRANREGGSARSRGLFSETIGGGGELPGLVPLTLETMFPGLEAQKQLAAKAAYELAQYQGEVLREAMAAERAFELQDQEEYENHRVDLMVEARQRGIDIEAGLSAQQLEQQIAAYDQQQEALRNHQEAVRQLYAQMIAQTAHAFGSMVGEMIAGKGDADAAMKELTAALGSTIGSFLIQMGSAAIASGIAASLLGTPAAIPAGVALVAAGAAFVALSSGLRASLRDAGDAGGVQAAASRTPPRFEDPFPRGFEAGPGFGGAQPQAANIVVNFNGIVDSRRAAREIRDVLGAT